MRTLRISIASMMGVILAVAVGLAVLRDPSAMKAGGMLMLTYGILALAVVGMVCADRAARPWWLGFGIFGAGYMAISRCWSSTNMTWLPTTAVLESLSPMMGVPFAERPMSCFDASPMNGLPACLDGSYEQAGQKPCEKPRSWPRSCSLVGHENQQIPHRRD